MATHSPLVLEHMELPDVIQYVLDEHTAPSTLVVCCSKDAFFRQLHAAVATLRHQKPGDETNEQATTPPSCAKAWSTPTLQLLASSRSVRVVFCPELAHLRAYLATCAYCNLQNNESSLMPPHTTTSLPLLAILNLIALHRPTSAYSAQGINRTLATAVEAAHHTHSQLILAECSVFGTSAQPDLSTVSDPFDSEATVLPTMNPWNEEVSILNVTTKSFGVGDRGWMGRTVSVRKIAGRWFHFKDMRSTNS